MKWKGIQIDNDIKEKVYIYIIYIYKGMVKK